MRKFFQWSWLGLIMLMIVTIIPQSYSMEQPVENVVVCVDDDVGIYENIDTYIIRTYDVSVGLDATNNEAVTCKVTKIEKEPYMQVEHIIKGPNYSLYSDDNIPNRYDPFICCINRFVRS